MAATMQDAAPIRQDAQQANEHPVDQDAEPGARWNPVVIRDVILALFIAYVMLAGLLIAVVMSAGSGVD